MSRQPGPFTSAAKPRTWADNHPGFNEYLPIYVQRAVLDPLACATEGTCARQVTYEELVRFMKLSINEPDAKKIQSPVQWKLSDMVEPLNMAMNEFGINRNAKRQAGFLAQLAHESGELSDWTENVPRKTAQNENRTQAYFNRKYSDNQNLGNRGGDDGELFRGRGPIQITGRDNYERFGRWLVQRDHPALNKSQVRGLANPMLDHPELLASDIGLGFLAAGWFWSKSRKTDANALCDALTLRVDDPHERSRFDALSRFVNRYDAKSFGRRWNYYVKVVAALTASHAAAQ